MANEYDGRVGYVVENYGGSELAARYGVRRYPAIFVDDLLVATPKDFGWYADGEGEGSGRYAPLKNADSHQRFRADLRRMLDLVLAGRRSEAAASATSDAGGEIAALPAGLVVADLGGTPIAFDALRGKAVIVELWATWCPPCRGALRELGALAERHGDDLVVIAVAIESDAEAVRKVAAELEAPLRFVLGTPELVRALGDVSGVPTMLVFDRDGRAAGSYFGAPPGLHEQVATRVGQLLDAAASAGGG